jgi:hypothetical protein
MDVVSHEAADRFRVDLAELARRGDRRIRRGAPVLVDPFLIARAVSEVMRACTFRGATGRRLLWNDYRVILARGDYDVVRSLQGPLERDLGQALANDAAASGAELVGELRVSVVADEGDELRAGQAVVRVAFSPTERLGAARAGELTVRFDAAQLAGLMRAVGSTETVIVLDATSGFGFVVRWPGGEAALAVGTTVVLGRPHDPAPAGFVALAGASARINKQQLWIAAGTHTVRIGRFAAGNPVRANGTLIAAGGELEITPPVELVLSHGELALSVLRA